MGLHHKSSLPKFMLSAEIKDVYASLQKMFSWYMQVENNSFTQAEEQTDL